MKCQRDGCERTATHSIRVNIPAVGWPIDMHVPLKMYVGLVGCREHMEQETKNDYWMATELREAASNALSMMDRAPPDFDRAWISLLKMDSDEYRQAAEQLSAEQ